MGDNPTTATDAHTVSSTKARLAVCAAKIIARLPVTVIVRLLKMFRPPAEKLIHSAGARG